MPHKRNPILVRADRRPRPRCCAATPRPRSRTSRSGTSATSATRSAERVILPDATILLDYMLVKMAGLVEGLVVRRERMRENIERGLGLHASSRVLVRARRARRDVAARRPTRSSSARRCGPPTSGRRCATCSPLDPAVAQRLSPGRARRLLRRRRVPPPRPRPSSPASTAWRPRPMPPAERARRLVPALRQGPRPVRARRRTACSSSRRTGISAFDVVLPTPIPDKGRVLTGPVAVLVRQDRRPRRRTTSSASRRRTSRRRAGDGPRTPPSCAAG